jgi:hypothetical protein
METYETIAWIRRLIAQEATVKQAYANLRSAQAALLQAQGAALQSLSERPMTDLADFMQHLAASESEDPVVMDMSMAIISRSAELEMAVLVLANIADNPPQEAAAWVRYVALQERLTRFSHDSESFGR